jgi:cystathionine beta-lyase/cystathionine gamma-synthase
LTPDEGGRTTNHQTLPLTRHTSRYLAGHNDVLAGSIAGRADLVETVRQAHNVLGGVIDPHAAYLLLRGMKTLDLRVERQVRVWGFV